MKRLTDIIDRDSSNDDDSIRWIATYEYDGRGRMTRERILRQDLVAGRMLVTQDVVTKYDLGNMATEIKLYDEYGLTITEDRTYGPRLPAHRRDFLRPRNRCNGYNGWFIYV